ncbi:hypothetical protein LLEC1_02748 [Akanthomyces lecanii]|uniref:Uncharacterized protein n=1 Tax=Cordyceps confragosa TaxID=2714763 RepID=A0A179I2Q2_CORDF|nr:hypothetical protein LLEC1_02748 [Akanthomyces lecanii]
MRRGGAYAGAVAFLAANAQRMVLTLSAVEMIASFSVPLSCIFAYNTPINGCDINDFTSGQCSPNCQRALQRVETNIRASCDTTDSQPNSLIREAQRGNLVNALYLANTFVDNGDLNRHYCFAFVKNVFQYACIHSHNVDHYTDVYLDNDTDNATNDTDDTDDSQLDVDRFKLEYRDRVTNEYENKLHRVNFFARNHHGC